jgi:hypothetical protein
VCFELWVRMNQAERKANRLASMRASEAAKVTNELECCVEDRYCRYLLGLEPGTRITEGWKHICNWITANFAVPDGDCESLHSHQTVLLMGVIGELCKIGFLEPRYPESPESEFVRTNKPDPVGEPWE